MRHELYYPRGTTVYGASAHVLNRRTKCAPSRLFETARQSNLALELILLVARLTVISVTHGLKAVAIDLHFLLGWGLLKVGIIDSKNFARPIRCCIQIVALSFKNCHGLQALGYAHKFSFFENQNPIGVAIW